MEEIKPSFIPLANSLEEYLQHNIDIITDSDWFAEKVAIVLKQHFTDKEVLEKIWDNRYETLKKGKKNG